MENNYDNKFYDEILSKKLASAEKVFWAGTMPPFPWMNASPDIYDRNKDHRLNPDFHQEFDLVYLVERNLGREKNWPMIIDEALRLMKPEGSLIILMTDSPLCSIFELKNLLNEWEGTTLTFEHTHENNSRLFCITKNNKTKRKNTLQTFSFGVITQGKISQNLENFIKSVQNIEVPNSEEIEIIICGSPEIKEKIQTYDKRIIFVEEPNDFKSNGWITRKKNLIVKSSNHENLILVHDRYTIPCNFIKKIQEYGPDFSVLVSRQEYMDGTRIPDWVTIGSEWQWTTPGILQYGDWCRYNFINGGIMIAKTEVLKKVPWNELLFWNQAEDIELTRRLKFKGYIPRLARNLLVNSTATRKNYFENFEYLPYDKNNHIVPGFNNYKAENRNPSIGLNNNYTFNIESQLIISQSGIYYDTNWTMGTDGLCLKKNTAGILAFRLENKKTHTFLLKFENQEKIKTIKINDEECLIKINKNGLILVSIDESKIISSMSARISIKAKEIETTLLSIRIELAETQLPKQKWIFTRLLTKIYNSKRSKFKKILITIVIVLSIIPFYLAKYVYKTLKNIKTKISKKVNLLKSNIGEF